MGFDKEIDYISHRYALRCVLIRELIIFPFKMPYAMEFDKGIDLFLIVMPCDGFL